MAVRFDVPPPRPQLKLVGGPAAADVERIPVSFESAYVWDYTTTRPDLRNLYEKSKLAQWNAKTDLPWHIDVDPEGENIPNQFIPIFGTRLWDKLDKKTELPKLRRHASA